MIADKLADEILQCTISFFNEKTKIAIVTKEDADLILELIEFSEEISCGDQIKNRIKENKEIIEESVENAPDGKKLKKVEKAYKYIKEKLFDAVENLDNHTTMAACKRLIKDCKETIFEIGEKLGKDDEFYIEISSEFVQTSMAMQINYANSGSMGPTTQQMNLFASLKKFDMNSETMTRLEENLKIIMRNRVERLTSDSLLRQSYGERQYQSTYTQSNSGGSEWIGGAVVGLILFLMMISC